MQLTEFDQARLSDSASCVLDLGWFLSVNTSQFKCILLEESINEYRHEINREC